MWMDEKSTWPCMTSLYECMQARIMLAHLFYLCINDFDEEPFQPNCQINLVIIPLESNVSVLQKCFRVQHFGPIWFLNCFQLRAPWILLSILNKSVQCLIELYKATGLNTILQFLHHCYITKCKQRSIFLTFLLLTI